MRVLALAALALVAGVASAQPPVSEWITVEVTPFADLVRPLQGPVSAPFRASVSCLLADGTGSVAVSHHVADAPAWATVVVAPASDARPVGECEQGRVAFEGTLLVTADDKAPAFAPAEVVLETAARGASGAQSGRGRVAVSASYFSILDAQLDHTITTIAPGGMHEFPITFTNFGNGETAVEMRLTGAPGGLDVRLPGPLVLGARGASDAIRTSAVSVHAPEEEGVVHRVTSVTVDATSFYAKDDSFRGDSARLTFLVTIRSGPEEDASSFALPLAWLLAPAGLALAAFLRRR